MKSKNMKALSGALLVAGFFTSVSFGAAQNNETAERARGAQAFNDLRKQIGREFVELETNMRDDVPDVLIDTEFTPEVRRIAGVVEARLSEIDARESDAFKGGFYTEPLRQGCRRVGSGSASDMQISLPSDMCEQFAKVALTRTAEGFNCMHEAVRACPVQDVGSDASGFEKTGMCLLAQFTACTAAATKK